MKKLSKFLSVVLAVTTVCTISASAYSTATYENRNFKTVSVPMDGTIVGQIVTANGTVHNDQDAKELIQSSVAKSGNTVVAAINGMFFNSYYDKNKPISFPSNCPLILTNLVQDGEVIVGNGKHNSVGFTKDGKVKIDVVQVSPLAMVNGRGPVAIWGVNGNLKDANAVALITDEVTLPYTIDSTASAFLIEDGVVTKALSGTTITLTKGQNLLIFNSSAAKSHSGWNLLPKVGSKVEITAKLLSNDGEDWSGMTSIASGGRMLVHNGKIVSADVSYNETLDRDPKQNATGVYQRSFIAVMEDDSVLLGTGTASFNEIAAYLKSKGAVDAMSLDGGASSMLYENGTGFVTPAGRKLASVIVFTKPNVVPVNCKTYIDGKEMTFDAFNIGRNNYFKLRDFAYALTGTKKQFNVEWDSSRSAIALTSKQKYTVVGGEMIVKPLASPDAYKLNKAPIFKDNKEISMTAYTINGNNYFKLRDICKAFDIGVEWDSSRNAVVVDTSKRYTD